MGKVILSQSMQENAITENVLLSNGASYPAIDVVILYLISITSIAFVTGITHYLLLRNNTDRYNRGVFSIMRDKFLDPSLSRFQFVAWTFVISFSYLSISLIRITSGDYAVTDTVDIPANILALMGISVAVPIAAARIHKNENPDQDQLDENFTRKISFTNILRSRSGNNRFDLARFQMFLWTLLGISVYLYTFFITVEDYFIDKEKYLVDTADVVALPFLTLPDIVPALLILMGLSQTAYIGTKMATKPSPDNGR